MSYHYVTSAQNLDSVWLTVQKDICKASGLKGMQMHALLVQQVFGHASALQAGRLNAYATSS